MRLRRSSIVLITCLSLVQAIAEELLEVTDLDREIDLTTQLSKVTHSLTVKNAGKLPTQQYVFCQPAAESIQTAFLEVVEGDSDDEAPLTMSPILLDEQPGNITCWAAKLSTPLQPGASTDLDVYWVTTKRHRAFPASIPQAEQQRVLYEDSAYVLSPYIVASQSTKVRLPTRRVESWTRHGQSVQTGSLLKYGRYSQTPAFAFEPIRVHFENNAPFAEVMRLEREIEVSHWGNIYVEERYELQHGGAKHQGVWSRLEYMQDPSRYGPASIREFTAHLPRSARWLYYKDDIGNVSTSNVRFGFDKVEAVLRPRFPLFGGWKVQFTFGWSLPLSNFVARLGGGRMRLTQQLSTPIQGVTVDDLIVKVVLPEGSTNIQASTPFPMQSSVDGRKYSYLDTSGRPVLVLKKSNLVPDHNKDLQVTYQVSPLAVLWEPLYLAVAVMLCFAGVMAYVRCELTISRDSAWAAGQARERMVDLNSRLEGLLAGRNAAVSILEDSDVGSWNLARATAEVALQESESQLNKLEREFSQVPGFKKTAELARLLEAERGLQTSALQLSSQRVNLLRQGLGTQEIRQKLERQEQSLTELQEDVARQSQHLLAEL